MRILDRQRYWSFFKAYLICFSALVGLVIVIDAFANLDEFSEVASGMQLLQNMGRYYLIRVAFYFDKLSGVIGMMAAVFAATWMQRNNELLAMLAAGVGTKRAIQPILVGAFLVNGFGIINQELIIPEVGDEMQEPPDSFEGKKITIFRGREDANDINFFGGDEGDPRTQSIRNFHATLPLPLVGSLGSISAVQARYIPPEASRSELRGGWLLRNAVLQPADAVLDPAWIVKVEDPDQLERLPKTIEGLSDLGGDNYFLRTTVSFAALTRKPTEWFRYASTTDLIRALSDPSNDPEKADISVYLHSRMIRPLVGMALLFLALPQVLGGVGRNMFVNLGISMGTTAIFYLALSTATYLGTSGIFSGELCAWAPLIVFGTVAAARWDNIST